MKKKITKIIWHSEIFQRENMKKTFVTKSLENLIVDLRVDPVYYLSDFSSVECCFKMKTFSVEH